MKWSVGLKKTLLVFLSILSFGLISPSQYQQIYEDGINKDDNHNPFEAQRSANSLTKAESSRDQFLSVALAEAERQSFEKFGRKIGPVIKNEFNDIVLPKIEEALYAFSLEVPDEKLDNVTISEKPAGGISEKIFHIYDSQTRKDLLRFHVRREHPPGQGYWFNFHYHTYQDQFEAHHQLARIYWDKDTPPHWLS